jgi:hypothetical protein
MNSSQRDAVHRTLAATRRLGWLGAAVLLLGCGGRASSPQISDSVGVGGSKADAAGGGSSSGSPAGGSALAVGGEAYQGGNDIAVSAGGALLANGCPVAEAGAAGAQAEVCDETLLYTAITRGATGGLGVCSFVASPVASEQVNSLHGVVVLDSEGRVIDNTGLMGVAKQRWLDQLCDRHWVCLAGETLGYTCTIED